MFLFSLQSAPLVRPIRYTFSTWKQIFDESYQKKKEKKKKKRKKSVIPEKELNISRGFSFRDARVKLGFLSRRQSGVASVKLNRSLEFEGEHFLDHFAVLPTP